MYCGWNHVALTSVKTFSFSPLLIWCHIDLVRGKALLEKQLQATLSWQQDNSALLAKILFDAGAYVMLEIFVFYVFC